MESERKATSYGLLAILIWSTAVALLRRVSETFGAIGGAALMYTLGAVMLAVLLGRPRLRGISRFYLLAGTGMFVLFEVAFSLALGYAGTDQQAIQVGIVNYLWPSLTVLIAIVMNNQPARWPVIPGTLMALVGIAWVVSGDTLTGVGFLAAIEANALSFGLATLGAVSFALYCNVTRKYANGKNLVTLFFSVTALALWLDYAFSDERAITLTFRGTLELVAASLSFALGYALWNIGVLRGNLTLLSTVSYFGPVFSSLFAAFWLDVQLSVHFWQGTLLVTLGSLLCWGATRQHPAARLAQAD
ncbi:aromatic amino acid DMT transporter YddG [Pseudomonas sp. CC120222-01a]|uniref:aromatic amino acid DMT transporter YddG n=1 Tax=Pseudomonas sp. CC120222-01a TaxID=1378075 RepID=UPI000D86B1D0|nr:aromatic amino acid DMT transporter YddG [Pseudomonas sp. CC120222-01a]PVZ41220.1 EamA-like transporter family protein [Pseudomonas sp. CC120222-01a]